MTGRCCGCGRPCDTLRCERCHAIVAEVLLHVAGELEAARRYEARWRELPKYVPST